MKAFVNAKHILWAAACGVCLSMGISTARATTYTVIDLGTPSGQSNAFATSINAAGNVIINGTDPGAVRYTGGSSYTNVASLAGNGDYVQQINNNGLMVGYSSDSSFQTQAVYAGGATPVLTKLTPLLPGGSGSAFGVSPTGVFGTATVVGNSLNSGGNLQAVTWVGNSVTALNPTNTTAWVTGGPSEAYGINSTGVIVGQAQSTVSGNLDAFMTGSTGVFTNIAPTGSTQSLAESISTSGFIVGNYNDTSADQLAFVHSPVTGMDTTLSILATPTGGLPDFSDAESINSTGQIVGESLAADGSQDAVIYDSTGAVTDLNTLISPTSGWTLTNAQSINDSGNIVGTGIFGGNQEAFLLVPTSAVPEPTTIGLMIASGIVLLGRARRR